MPGWLRLDRRTTAVTALFMLGVAFLAGVPTAIGLAGPFGWAPRWRGSCPAPSWW